MKQIYLSKKKNPDLLLKNDKELKEFIKIIMPEYLNRY